MVLAGIVNLIKRRAEEASTREFESRMSKLTRTPAKQSAMYEAGKTIGLAINRSAEKPIRNDGELKKQNDILRQILTAIKNQPKSQAKPKPDPASKPSPTPESQHATSDEIIQEVIAALVKMGHTKTEANKIVAELCENSTFNSSEELLQAAFSK